MNTASVIGIGIITISALIFWLPKPRRIISRYLGNSLPYHTGSCENRCDKCREGLGNATLVILYLFVLLCVLFAVSVSGSSSYS